MAAPRGDSEPCAQHELLLEHLGDAQQVLPLGAAQLEILHARAPGKRLIKNLANFRQTWLTSVR